MTLTQETVHLVTLEGQRAVYIDKVEGPHSMTISSRVGKEARMHCSGVGKVLLAHMPDEARDSIIMQLDMTRYTERTITDKRFLVEHLRVIREQGYAIDDEEIEIGLCCVAAPIFNARNHAVGAVSISGPSARLMRERFKYFTEQVQETTKEISRLLGNGTQKTKASERREA
jgi:DNA-binding IclR family transcriptional regulator